MMIRRRIDPETHPARLVPLMDEVAGTVHRLQKAAETAGPEEMREMIAQTLGALQTTADCVAALTRRAARARN